MGKTKYKKFSVRVRGLSTPTATKKRYNASIVTWHKIKGSKMFKVTLRKKISK